MGAIGFFAPLPIALMIPFMGAQSAVMGEAFGKHFQYGKRKISAMSNEDFNKLTSAELFDDTLHGFAGMIPKLEQSMRRTEGLQSFVIEQLIRYVRSIPDDIISGLTSGPVSESPLIQNLEGNLQGGIDIANSIAQATQDFQKAMTQYNIIPKAFADPIPEHKPIIKTGAGSAFASAPELQKEIVKIMTNKNVRPTPSTVGPFKNEPQTKANLTLIAAGLRPDLRKPVVTKLRPPKSIVIQMRKYEQEIIALDNRLKTYIGSSRYASYAKNFGRIKQTIFEKMAALRLKYSGI